MITTLETVTCDRTDENEGNKIVLQKFPVVDKNR